ncbi:MAG TPA: SRPBCC family protein [Prolixibacteraceae bacterium]|nr:SRPBCC family protein [Prolixibacteraceae bacterium]
MTSNSSQTETQMLIRRPIASVFNAFVDPAITSHFWFTKSSGRLEKGQTVTWQWEMYNVSANVLVKELEPNRSIAIEWGEPVTTVEFHFQSLSDGSTYVTITESGYRATGDELLQIIKDSTSGFTTVLDGLKAYLEHGINLNLIADKFPKEVIQHGN